MRWRRSGELAWTSLSCRCGAGVPGCAADTSTQRVLPMPSPCSVQRTRYRSTGAPSGRPACAGSPVIDSGCREGSSRSTRQPWHRTSTLPSSPPVKPSAWSPELDAKRFNPSSKVAVDRGCSEWDWLVELPLDRMEDEWFRLRSTESAVRADLLLERGDFTELRIELADQQEVGGMRHGILATDAGEG